MKTKKVWIASRIEYADGKFEMVDQKVCATREDAEGWWEEWIADIGFALEDMGADEDEIETEYDADNLFYELRYNGDFVWVVAKEVEMAVEE